MSTRLCPIPSPPAVARCRRSGQRGQIVPLLALMFVVLTGAVALVIDAGVGYNTKRNDQDVADAAALAASYWIYDATSGTSLTGAYTAGENVVDIDCSGLAGPCTEGFTLTVYSSWTSPSSNTSVATLTSSGCTGSCTVSSSDVYVGSSIAGSSPKFFGQTISKGSTLAINASAVAEVSSTGGGSGSSSTNPTQACEICVFGNVTLNSSSDDLEAAGGSIDINGYVNFDSSSDAVKTTNSYGIDVAGTTTDSGSTVAYTGSSDNLEASGTLGIEGNVLFDSSSDTISTDLNSKTDINISGTVTNNGSSNTIDGHAPSTTYYGTGATSSFSDPLASIATPTYSTYSAPTYSGMTNNGAWSYPDSPCTSSDTISPGIYTSITDNCSSSTLNFNPGLYVIDGSTGIDMNSSSQTLASPSGDVTIYFTCNSGGAPASCGTWNSSTGTCSSTSSGSELQINGSSATIDLSGGYNGGAYVYFYDRCNSNQDGFYGNTSSINVEGSAALYGHSAGIWLNGSAESIPGPLLVGNIVFDSSSITLGTTSGAASLGGSSPSSPGGLVG